MVLIYFCSNATGLISAIGERLGVVAVLNLYTEDNLETDSFEAIS